MHSSIHLIKECHIKFRIQNIMTTCVEEDIAPGKIEYEDNYITVLLNRLK